MDYEPGAISGWLLGEGAQRVLLYLFAPFDGIDRKRVIRQARMNANTVKIPTARAVAGFIAPSLPCHAVTRARRGRRAARPEILFTVPARWCELDKATDAGAFCDHQAPG
jgi:hypothetical protein